MFGIRGGQSVDTAPDRVGVRPRVSPKERSIRNTVLVLTMAFVAFAGLACSKANALANTPVAESTPTAEVLDTDLVQNVALEAPVIVQGGVPIEVEDDEQPGEAFAQDRAVVPEPIEDEPAEVVVNPTPPTEPEPPLEPVVGGDTGGDPNDQEQKVVDPPLPSRDDVVRQLQENTNVEFNLGGLQISEDGLQAIEALCDKGLEMALFDFQADIDAPSLNADTIFSITYDYASLVVANDAAGLELRRQLVENGYSMISQQLGLWYGLRFDDVSNTVDIRVYFDAKGDNDAMIRALRNGVFSVFPFIVDGKVLQQPHTIQGTNAVNGSMLKPGIKAQVEEQTISIAKRIQ